MNFVSLGALPLSHALRNRPLAEIGARYSNVRGNGRWNTVTVAYGIAKSTFNDLGQAWKENNLWQAPL